MAIFVIIIIIVLLIFIVSLVSTVFGSTKPIQNLTEVSIDRLDDEPSPEQDSDYSFATTLHVTESQRFLPKIEKAGVRFLIQSNVTQPDVVTSDFGGFFGQGADVEIFVHHEDMELFEKIFAENYLDNGEGNVDWRDNLRGN